MNPVPVITVDGPSGSGKGTLSTLLAQKLKWHYLDSGALYRIVAWAALHYKVAPDDEPALVTMIERLDISMQVKHEGEPATIFCDGEDVTKAIRVVECSRMASTISAIPAVRTALMDFQRRMRKAPGLVTDGRDMGTVVFPDAVAKFFLEAGVAQRAQRRYNQLKGMGINVSLPNIEQELVRRDGRDSTRSVAPLMPAQDAILVDTTSMSIEQVLQCVMGHLQNIL